MTKADTKTPAKIQEADRLSPKAIMSLPGRQALDVILEAPTPARVIQSLAEEDLYLFIHDLGFEDALPVLARASNDQWQYILDLELWDKDRLSNEAMHRWQAILMEAAPERFATWSLGEHLELLELFLSRNMDVRICEEQDSPCDFGDDFFSLDGVFYIRIRDEKNAETLRSFLERLADLDVGAYHRILLEMTSLMPAEMEELLYRQRNVRLAEKGLLPFDEALAVYQPLGPEDLLGKDEKARKDLAGETLSSDSVVPVSKALLLEQRGPFYAALANTADWVTLERLQLEFAALCNQVLSADQGVAKTREDLATIVRKVCSHLDVGLEALGGKGPEEMASFVERFPLHQIFRVGYGAVLELKWKAQKWLRTAWFAAQGFEVSFWDTQWGEILEGLLSPRPLLPTGFAGTGESYGEFKSLTEVTRCHHALDRMMALDGVFSRLFPQAEGRLPERGYQPMTYKNLLLTGWARYRLGLAETSGPLTTGQMAAFFKGLWGETRRPHRISQETRDGFFDWLQERFRVTASEMGLPGRDAVVALLDELEKEYGGVAVDDLDPRYVKHIVVSIASNE